MLKQRIITAVFIVGALLAALLLLPPPALTLLFGALVALAAWEWANLSGLGATWQRLAYSALCVAAITAVAWHSDLLSGSADRAVVKEWLRVACVWWAIALLWVRSYPGSAALWGSTAMRGLIGLLVLVPTWLALSYLRLYADGVALILFVIALVAAADTGAYFAGRAWGKAKLAPRVSPGKSWAGFWGGLTASLCLAALVWFAWPGGMPIELQALLPLAAVTALASVLGDLLESMVKRHRGVKDSGALLPGHGGIMDRLDSLTAATPVFTLGLILAGW